MVSAWLGIRSQHVARGIGASDKEPFEGFCRYIERCNPLSSVLIPPRLSDGQSRAYVACNKTSLLMDSDRYQSLCRPLMRR